MNNQRPVDRRVSEDHTYIDYTRTDSGVRVWKDKCQAIALNGSEWIGQDPSHRIPLSPVFKDTTKGVPPDRSPLYLFLELGQSEGDPKGKEANEIVYGRLDFEKVMSTL
jgi:hypothetical protein